MESENAASIDETVEDDVMQAETAVTAVETELQDQISVPDGEVEPAAEENGENA